MPKKPLSRPPSAPPPSTGRGSTPWLAIASVVTVVAVGGAWYLWSGPAAPDQQPPASAPAAASASAPAAAQPAEVPENTTPPVTAKFGPHKQENLPPMPFGNYPPARPIEVVRAAYQFAAEHPEVLSYVPCYCGCENSGHRGNDDCFVKSRAANGDVTEWEPHGMVCQICIDVAHDAMQMYASGASVRDIRAANERKWSGQFATRTPTPSLPKP